MLDAIDYSRGEAEDMFFVEHVPRVGGRLASRQAAAAFSLEAADDVGVIQPVGFHAAQKYLGRERVEGLLRAVERSYGS